MVTMIIFLSFILVFPCNFPVYGEDQENKIEFPNAHKDKTEEPTMLGKSACLIDAKTGYVLFGFNEHEKAYPASTTKILTGLLAMENLDLNEQVIIDKEADEQGGSQLYLSEGEIMTVDDLMYGMMLPSANDAAVAIGNAMGGSIAGFAVMMNEKAKSIGAEDSNFVNPNGLPDKNHYTSAYDLSVIAKEAMKYDDFRRYVTTYEYTIPKTNMSDGRLIHNRNRLLYNINRKVSVYGETKSLKYDGVTGIKTGYTDKAKFCLVGSALRNETELIAVTMKSKDMDGYYDVVAMLDYGFNNFKTIEVMREGENVEGLRVTGGTEKYATAAVKDGLFATLPVGVSEEDVRIEKKFSEVKAPFESNTDGGTIEVYYNDEKVGEADITITEAMAEGTLVDDIKTGSGIMGLIKIVAIVIAVLLILIFTTRAINRSRQRKARRRRRMERVE